MKIDLMTSISIGTMLIIGSGLFWVVCGEFDCSQVKSEKIQQCKQLNEIGNYMPIGIILGFMVLGLSIILTPGDKEQKQNNKNFSRSAI